MHSQRSRFFRYGIAAVMLTMAAFLISSPGHATEPGFWSYPVVRGHGGVHVWPQSQMEPDANGSYKAVFDITQAAHSPEKIAPGFEHVARAVNVFAAAGVPATHLKFVVIVHGKATPAVLNDNTYRARFHAANPNLALIATLRKVGVKVLVCGNALGEMKLTPADIDPEVGVALSALSTLVILEDEGYALIPM